MKKRLLPLLLIAALLLSLAACGQAAPAATETPSPAGTPEPPAPAATETKPEPVPEATDAPAENGGIYVKTDGAPDRDGEETGYEPEAPADGGWYGEVSFAAESAAAAGGMGAIGSPESAGDITVEVGQTDPGEPFVLTAAEWNDNENWPFFANLVNAGTIEFPSFGLDPRNRVKVTVMDGEQAVRNEPVQLLGADGGALWTARTDRNGVAFLFWRQGEAPDSVSVRGEQTPLEIRAEPGADQQGSPVVTITDEMTVSVGPKPADRPVDGLQVMFIVDTTGSMGDELSYLQKDFSEIAGEFDGQGIEWSACFYRDEGDDYVTRVSEFSADTAAIRSLIEAEYAAGGGDTPEAVAQILDETLNMGFVQAHERNGWRENAEKLAFLIFDAPPHEGTDAILDAAVRRAAEAGIRVIPVVASNAERETELFGRALSILTGGTYVFLTDDSGVGNSHLEPIVGAYTVEKLHDVIVRIIGAHLPG